MLSTQRRAELNKDFLVPNSILLTATQSGNSRVGHSLPALVGGRQNSVCSSRPGAGSTVAVLSGVGRSSLTPQQPSSSPRPPHKHRTGPVCVNASVNLLPLSVRTLGCTAPCLELQTTLACPRPLRLTKKPCDRHALACVWGERFPVPPQGFHGLSAPLFSPHPLPSLDRDINSKHLF